MIHTYQGHRHQHHHQDQTVITDRLLGAAAKTKLRNQQWKDWRHSLDDLYDGPKLGVSYPEPKFEGYMIKDWHTPLMQPERGITRISYPAGMEYLRDAQEGKISAATAIAISNMRANDAIMEKMLETTTFSGSKYFLIPVSIMMAFMIPLLIKGISLFFK